MFYKRPLVPCIIAYIFGLWLVYHVWHHWAAGAVILACVVTGLGIYTARRRRDMTAIYLLMIMMAGMAVMAVRGYKEHAARLIIDEYEAYPMVVVSGRVTGVADLDDMESQRAVLRNVTLRAGDEAVRLPGKMQVSLPREALSRRVPIPGEYIAFPARVFKPTALQNFFGYDRLKYLRHQGIFSGAAALKVAEVVTILPASAGLFAKIELSLTQFRRRVTENLKRDMWPQEARLMTAMLFNDMRGMTDEEKTIFRDSGTFHLFAVSGMHVAILGLSLHLLFRVLQLGVSTSWVAVAAVLFIYLWIIDFVPSATRAYLMLLAFMMGYVFKRETDSLTSLVFAVAAVVVFDPVAPWNAGFVLSAGGVAAIVLFTPLLRLWFPLLPRTFDSGFVRRIGSWIVDVFYATLAVSVFLMPLQIYYFGFWNLLSPIANLLQAALAGCLLAAGVVVAAVGLVWPVVAEMMGQVASALMSLTYLISAWAAEFPGAIMHFSQLPLWLLLICYALLLGGYYMVFRDTPEFKLKSRARFTVHVVCSLGVLFAYQQIYEVRRTGMEMWFLDVGQGDSSLIRFPNGQTMLIDGGKSDPDAGLYTVVPQLRGLGIGKLDYIVATHDDDDHSGGLATVVRQIGCRYLLLPHGFAAQSRASQALLHEARQRSVMIRYVAAGDSAEAGNATVHVLNPQREAREDISDNDRSIVLRVSFGDFDALFMGDAGLAVESRLVNERSIGRTTLLKAGHHGSHTSTGDSLVDTARPVCAVISCGRGNNFGHPARDVVKRLYYSGAEVLRTDQDGAVVVKTDGDKVSVRTRVRR